MECLLAAGVKRQFTIDTANTITSLQDFINEKNGWLFGHIGYDLKNEIEKLSSAKPDFIRFPDMFFFEPEVVIKLSENEITIEAVNPDEVYKEIEETGFLNATSDTDELSIKGRISKEEYIDIIHQLKHHIHRGDCYEINFCQEFFADDVIIDPTEVYKKLSTVSPNPFSALYRMNEKWLICASPERFIKKQGCQIISQPIKGTSKRIPGDVDKDLQNRNELQQSNKDRAENVMVVDLVRNDLAKLCKEGSVKVDELYGIYSFPQVHQMISTVSGELKEDVTFTDIIKATFPMGSMTGAPKKKVMELIEIYEKTKRGIFSGAVGYISPADDLSTKQPDFDFNVVIRSIMYNAEEKYVSFQAGSGITFYSDPEKEWEECLMKAEAIKKVLMKNS